MATNRKNNKDYNNGKIYCIRNTIDDDIYVGSTTQPLSKRMAAHRSDLKYKKHINKGLLQKADELGVDKLYIELIEEYPCENLEQLNRKEGEHIRQIGTLNKMVAGRTKKEYRANNKEKIAEKKSEYWKKYYENVFNKLKRKKN